MPARELEIEGARQNNLKNISLSLPQDRVVVVTGVSGSGKSSLAFDTIFAEGQWRFIESLSTYARLFLEKIDRPEVDAIRNIRPAIALEQRNPIRGSRATVGTATELYDYFRLLYAAVARPVCPSCGRALSRWTLSSVVGHLLRNRPGRRALIMFETGADRIEMLERLGFHRFRQGGREVESVSEGPVSVVVDRLVIDRENEQRLADSLETAWKQGGERVFVDMLEEGTESFSAGLSCESCGLTMPDPQPLLFSFNHPTGACPKCNGFGNILDYDPERIIPDDTLSLRQGAIEPWAKPAHSGWYREFLKDAAEAGVDIDRPFGRLPRKQKKLIFEGGEDLYSIREFFEELEGRRYKLHVRVFLSRYRRGFPCPGCAGARLKDEALMFRLGGSNIAEISEMPFKRLDEWQSGLEFSADESARAAEPLRLIRAKLGILRRLGLDYLTMSRQSKTLSGGEAQRVNLSNQLAARLTGTLYVLDEPTVGLHPRDTERICGILRELSRTGNSVIVVEHDRMVIESADWVVDMGPGGGHRGGTVLYSGEPSGFRESGTLTAAYLKGVETVGSGDIPRRDKVGPWLKLSGASGNNLRNITASFPLGTLTCVTGVSGSGKSTLVEDTLFPAVSKALKSDFRAGAPYERLEGQEYLKGVKLIDQSPIGRSPRSNPATYLDVFNPVRKVFASQPEAKRLGLGPGDFSFNVPGGRCDACNGEGYQRLEMYFFEDLYVTCDECKGRRYKNEVLYVTYLGRDIHQVLEMTVDEAMTHFADMPAVIRRLAPLQEMGLGYISLGQPAPTLSGGEAQRLKICAELGSAGSGGMLYILDEPTTGLHFHDVKKFLGILHRLVEGGNTVVVVEHNLDVIASADWIIDLGPEAGEGGGMIVAVGEPQTIMKEEMSHTGRALRQMLPDRAVEV